MSARLRYGNDDGSVPAEIQELLEEKDAEIEELKNQLLRQQADSENYRKRLTKKVEEQQKFAAQPLILEILEAVDDFERAFQPDNFVNEDKDAILQGFFQICLKILSALQTHGVTRIETENVPFDPNLHEAVQIEESEGVDPNSIVKTLRNGYFLHERIIRVAQVTVSPRD